MRTIRRLSIAAALLAAAIRLPAAAAPRGKPSAQGKEPAAKSEKPPLLSPNTWKGLALRSIGPALTSGRVTDMAVLPRDPSTYYVAAASGGVWKTANAGVTWTPVFDGEGSYSIGCVAVDPYNPSVVWVGTGEFNGQRSVSYGDGVYKSEDGGKSWQNVGLKSSEHVARILIDPLDTNIVYAAAQGPLWSAGGDRGLYKTTDGGKTWKAVLTISENTGVSDVVMDPRDPNFLLASAHQRRRHVWTVINGGPESALYRSTDAGATWKKIESGLPKEEMGKIGLAIAPSDPDIVYAIVEAANKAGGLFRSTDRGVTWEKRSDHSTSGQYYGRIFVDPKNPDRVYSVDVFLQVSDDGGKTFRNLGESSKHVDNHVLWIDPADTRHYRVGCDGGVYESFDRGATWEFKANLPVTQFYRVVVDEASPIYNVYGGTQDNNTLGGPSRTLNVHGITNADWWVTVTGDGFQPRVDPRDPDIIYSEAQYGEIVRVNRKTGDALYIKPQAGKGEDPLRWNWDSPLLISPHSHTRLYFAAQRIFRSDDRGESWKPVSPDLTRRIDRNQLPVMGRIWPADAVAKNSSTSFYGNIVALAESPKQEGLLYAGTDDGLVQVTEDGGATWRRTERFPGVPDRAYVARLEPSAHDASTVYAAFDNHKMGDFKPYLLESADRGRSWVSIAGDLPDRGTVYCVVEDPGDKSLLFAGTEFGLFFTRDGGRHWVPLKGGLPTIAVRDLAIQ
ncbi:MAG: VPS10 domain-containing protein, partial [Acidobacteriota bacterium]